MSNNKDDILHIVRGSAWLLTSYGVSAIMALGVAAIITRVLSPTEFGQYRFFLAFVPILGILALPGTNQALVRSVAQGNFINLPALVTSKIRWGLIGSGISLTIMGYYALHDNWMFVLAFFVLGLGAPFFDTFLTYSFYYTGRQLFKVAAQREIITRLVYAASVAITAALTHSVLWTLCAFFISQIGPRFYFFVRTLHDDGYRKQDAATQPTDDTLAFGKHLSVVATMNVIVMSIDKLLIWHFLGAEILAAYIVALLIPTELSRGLSIIPQVLLPGIVQGNFSTLRTARHKLYYFGAVLLGAVLLYAFFIPVVIEIFFPTYAFVTLLALMAAPLVILRPLQALLTTILIAKKRPGYILFVQTLNVLLTIIAILLAIHFFQNTLSAIILALVVIHTCIIFVQAILVRKLSYPLVSSTHTF